MEKDKHAIVVFPSGIKQDSRGKWVSTDLSEEDDKLGAPGGKLRVHAGAVLSRSNPDASIITHGGHGYDIRESAPTERPMLSEILRDELLELGILESKIILERHSNTTFQGIGELERIVEQQGFEQITIVTNRYHVPRVTLMIQTKFAALHDKANVEVLSAEDILLNHEPVSWKEVVRNSYNSPFMLERMKKEEQGIRDIQNGTYKFR